MPKTRHLLAAGLGLVAVLAHAAPARAAAPPPAGSSAGVAVGAAVAEVAGALGGPLADQLDLALSDAEVVSLAEALAPRSGTKVSVAVETADGGLEVVALPVRAGAAGEVSALLGEADDVVAAAPESRSFPSSDPYRSAQWALGTLESDTAWTHGTGAGVTVAVVDTGVDGTHPDLAGNLVPGADCWTGSCGDGGTSDASGHGTHVAGIIGAVAGNGIGVAGLAPDVSVMPVNVFGPSASASGTAVAVGIVWATDHGADVVNLSLGGPTKDPVQQAAVRYANRNGVVVVAATGNEGTTAVRYPAGFPEVMAVSATDSSDARPGFSNAGGHVAVAAPGVGIVATVPGGYGGKSGTSMASPYAAAAAALVLGEHRGLTPGQVKHLLTRTAVDLGPAGRDNSFGWGRIRPLQAVTAAVPAVTGSVSLPVGASVTGVISLTPKVALTGGMEVEHLSVSLGGVTVVDDALDIGESTTRSIDTRQVPNGTRALTASFTDAAGRTWSRTVDVTVANPPGLSVDVPSTVTGTLHLAPSVTAPTGGRITSVQLLAGPAVVATDASAPWSLTWNSATRPDGVVDLVVRATPASGPAVTVSARAAVWNRPAPALGTVAGTVSATVAVPVTVSSAPGGSPATAVVIDVLPATGSTRLARLAATGSGSSWTAKWSTSALANGTYRLRATAINAAGAASTAATPLKVNNSPRATMSTSASRTTVTARATASSPVGAAITRAELLVDGAVVATDTTSPWTLQWRATTGRHVLKVRVTDAAGRTGTSATQTVIR